MELNLKNKVAVITGGSSGIGLAVAHALAREGVHVALCARHEDVLAKAAADVKNAHAVRTFAMPVDVTRLEQILAFTAAVEKEFGGCDILINNAGEGSNETLSDASDERWQYYLDLLLMSAVRMSRTLTPSMKKRGGGVILNNASICALQPLPHGPIYATAKAALVMYSKCLATELIPFNIRVNAINPGLIRTAGWETGGKEQAARQGISLDQWLQNVADEHAPIKRFASAEEVANLFVFLASDRASYCVGSSYYIDGGWLSVTT